MTAPRFPAGVPCWIELVGVDPDAAADFYRSLFGWEVTDGVARLDGAAVAGLGSPGASVLGGDDGPARWATTVAVDDLDATARAVTEHGGTVRTGPADVGGGTPASVRVAQVTTPASVGLVQPNLAAVVDPSGASLGLAAAGAPMAEVVNAPGTWNWSDLATDDAEGAAAFYGAVFGWRAVPLPAFGATMWQQPGYADHLDALDPGRAERHAADGVPEGFGDAVGWLVAPGPAGAGWVVTFAVDDTDGAAERVVAGGGMVVAAPHDLGPTRLAVVEDPFGARLTLSHYRPG